MSLESHGEKVCNSSEAKGTEGDQLIKSIMNSLRGKTGSDSGGNSDSNNGNTSDNSALASIGNSEGFYNEEGMSNNSKEGQNDSNDDSDGVCQQKANVRSTSLANQKGVEPSKPSLVQSEAVANAAVTSLRSIATSCAANYPQSNTSTQQQQNNVSLKYKKESSKNDDSTTRKRRASASGMSDDRSVDEDSGGYNTDDDDGDLDENPTGGKESSSKKTSGGGKTRGGKKKRADSNKREERNQREKERSLRISKQIGELRNLLSSGGVVVPKGTKSSVLTEAANYIRILQQHQYRSEIDRHQLVQQMQQIGAGAHGPQAAAAIRHAAAQNGVWSLGNFGGIPPKSAMTFYDPTKAELSTSPPKQPQIVTSAPAPTVNPFNQTKQVDPTEYRFVFNSCGAGIAIASMGGAFIDCNQLFCQLSNYTKQEICSLTIFNLTARQDLQAAFDQISQLISPPMEESGNSKRERPKPVVFRGAMKNRDDLGLSVSLVKGDDGVSKCFCVTIVKNRESPFDTAKPIPVSFEAILPGSAISKEIKEINTSPAFTSG